MVSPLDKAVSNLLDRLVDTLLDGVELTETEVEAGESCVFETTSG